MFPLSTVWAYCQVKDRELSSGKGQDVDETGKTGAPVAERTVERSDFSPMDCGSGRTAAFAAGGWRATVSYTHLDVYKRQDIFMTHGITS